MGDDRNTDLIIIIIIHKKIRQTVGGYRRLPHAGPNGSRNTLCNVTVGKEIWRGMSLVKHATQENAYRNFTSSAVYV